MYFHAAIAMEGAPFEWIQDAVQLEEDPLKRVLDSLTFGKQKILNRGRPLKEGGKDRAIVNTDVFAVNAEFASKVLKLTVS